MNEQSIIGYERYASTFVMLRGLHSCAKVFLSVILYYDHAITLAEERRLIERAPWCRITLVFLINRYFSFFAVESFSTCDVPLL